MFLFRHKAKNAAIEAAAKEKAEREALMAEASRRADEEAALQDEIDAEAEAERIAKSKKK
jgi:hypothetical protein